MYSEIIYILLYVTIQSAFEAHWMDGWAVLDPYPLWTFQESEGPIRKLKALVFWMIERKHDLWMPKTSAMWYKLILMKLILQSEEIQERDSEGTN